MNLERLQIFYAVANEKSFSKAGKKLNKTQSAVSQSINMLEAEVGERLFLRNNRSVILSEAGKILFEHVVAIIASIDEARLRIDSLRNLCEGELVISSSNTSACYLLPPVLREFKKRYPRVRIILKNGLSSQAAEMVAQGESDVGIVMLPIDNPKLESIPLALREDVLITCINHDLSIKENITIEDLAKYEFILLENEAHTRQYIDSHFSRYGLTPKVAMEVGTMEVIKQMVKLDLGVSVIPRIAVKNDHGHSLCVKSIFQKNELREMGVVVKKSNSTKLAVKAFIDVIKEYFNGVEMI